MAVFEPRDPDFQTRIRESFAQQRMMQTLGAELKAVRPGEVEIELPFSDEFTQQHGYLHAAAVTAIADSACGYAAYTLMEADHDILSVEFKVNLLAPAAGERFIATGRVIRPGRTLTVCSAEVRSQQGGTNKLVAV
ncbi:MAG: PaaI family thioesterase, partial [Rubricoccaceae bacterium]|nr:PaaI family thioesterase [Rubricoccaceae bacterium]